MRKRDSVYYICPIHQGPPFDNSLSTVTIIGKKAYFGDGLMSWSSNAKARLPGFKF